MNLAPETKVHLKKKAAPDIPVLEWVIGAAGLLFAIAVVGVLLHEAVAGNKSPPDVQLTVQTIAPLRNGFLVKIRAKNLGGEPAARVAIIAEMRDQSQVLESSETQFEHLPPHAFRDAGVFFAHDPRPHEIRLRAQGYEVP